MVIPSKAIVVSGTVCEGSIPPWASPSPGSLGVRQLVRLNHAQIKGAPGIKVPRGHGAPQPHPCVAVRGAVRHQALDDRRTPGLVLHGGHITGHVLRSPLEI